ncbi:MAG: hypothetical protein SVM79_01905 [Chloroflexota bacterium]|nr:hypothetical protein [Chloroflexota bacterium]
MEIEFAPDLSHCIQTLARREHERITRQLLESNEVDVNLHQRLELLRMFLESANFGKLRGEYEKHLLEGKRIRFFVQAIDGQVKYKTEIS